MEKITFTFKGENIQIFCEDDNNLGDICEKLISKYGNDINILNFIYGKTENNNKYMKCKIRGQNIYQFEEKANNEKINYNCNKHNKSYVSYCLECEKDLCINCVKNHNKNHRNEKYKKIKPKIKDIKIIIENIKKNFDKLKNIVKKIINTLLYTIKKVENIYREYNDLLKNYELQMINYELLQKMNKIKDNTIIEYLNKLNDNDNINNKMQNIISIYNKIIKNESNNEITIKYKLNKNEDKVRNLFQIL